MSLQSIKEKNGNRPSWLVELERTPRLKRYITDVTRFLTYLQQTDGLRFRVHGEKKTESGVDDILIDMPYVHRWTESYRRGVLAKFYALDAWMESNDKTVTMITLTTYQDGEYSKKIKGGYVTIEASFELLKKGWGKMRQRLRGYNYVWIIEPHKTGYPHIHCVIFGELTSCKQLQIKELWAKYGVGSEKEGVNFESRKPEESIRSLRNYLMKYMVKGFRKTGSKFGEPDHWTTPELVFNALVKKHQWRLFGANKELSRVMKYTKKKDADVTYYATELQTDAGAKNLVWLRTEKTGWKNHVMAPRMPPTADMETYRDL